MRRLHTYLFFSLFIITLSHIPINAETVVSERILFLEEDGRHYLYYKTARTDYSNYSFWYKKEQGRESMDDYLNQCLYLYPNLTIGGDETGPAP